MSERAILEEKCNKFNILLQLSSTCCSWPDFYLLLITCVVMFWKLKGLQPLHYPKNNILLQIYYYWPLPRNQNEKFPNGISSVVEYWLSHIIGVNLIFLLQYILPPMWKELIEVKAKILNFGFILMRFFLFFFFFASRRLDASDDMVKET